MILRASFLCLVLGAAAFGQDSGWRGDGTGRYPSASPPVSWGRVSGALQGLRFRAAKPGPQDAGTPMADGVVREWLVLHPAPEGSKVDKEVLPGEADLSPAENEKTGDAVWRKVPFESAWMDFNALLGKTGKGVACAITHIHSETGGPFRLNATTIGAAKIVLNGKSITPGYGRTSLELAKGWNRLLLKVAPHEIAWACSFNLHARAPAQYQETNIAWTLPLPGVTGGFYGGGTGVGSPVIVGDRLYLLSEPHDLVCVDKRSGKVLWVRTSSYFDAAVDADRKKPGWAEAEAQARRLQEINALLPAGPLSPKQLQEKVAAEQALSKQMQEIDPVRYRKWDTPDVGFSGFAPVTDGKSIYLWLGSGVTACYDLDGNRRWIRVDNLPAIEHGFSSSPVLVDGKIIVFMRDLIAIDAKTGALAWQIPLVSHQGANPQGFYHGTPAPVNIGGVPLVVLGNGTIVRAADGKILLTQPSMGTQAIPSPVLDGNRLLLTTTHSATLYIHTLPAAVTEPFKMETRTASVATTAYPHYYMPWHMASPVVVDGLAYLVNNSGVLTVVDLNEAKVVYQKMLDIDHFQTANEGPARGCGISPALGGKHLFVFGNNGASVVIETGRTFRQVAKNKIESLVSVGHWGERQERFVSNPVFDGDRLYLRGEGHLYALQDGRTSVGTTSSAAESAPAKKPVTSVPSATTPAEVPVLPPGYFGWRRDGTGLFPEAAPPTEWNEKKNIKWQATVGAGHSSPVLAGDRVVVVAEPGVLHCLNRADGRTLWKADLEFRNKGGPPPGTKEFARLTPVTDGKNVYLALCNGAVASVTLEGTLRWTRQVEAPRLTYGPSASPVLVGDKLLVDATRLHALDAATGRSIWTAAEGEAHYGTPAVFSLGGTVLAVTAKGTVVRVSDGAVLATAIAPGLGGDQAPSPVVQSGVVYFAYRRCSAVKLSIAAGKLKADKLWEQELPGDVISSPILKDGMLFVVPSGSPEYRVLNAATGEVVLEKGLDLSPNIYPSLAAAGKYLFLGNDRGEMSVLELGRDFKLIRTNEIPEGSGASPVFAGSHLFLRGGQVLYCIGP